MTTPSTPWSQNLPPVPPAVEQFGKFLGSPKGQKITLAAQVILLGGIIAALTVQQVQFRDTWSRECDYNIKVWSTVWLSRALIQHVIVLIITILVVKKHDPQLALRLRNFQGLLSLFKCAWFLYGIKVVLVDEHCDETSGTWGLALWWLDIAILVAPCAFACLLAPVILCCFSGREVHPEQHPTPEDVKSELKPVKCSGQEVKPCQVCFSVIESEDMVVKIPCRDGHTFHAKCILSWLDKSQRCPVCQTNIVDAIKNLQRIKDPTPSAVEV